MGLQVLDRRYAPLPWDANRDRVARDCQWAHNGLLLAWPGWHPSGPISAGAGGSLGVQNDPFRHDLTQSCHCQVGDGYRGRTYKVAALSSYFGTIQPLVNVRQTDVPLPTASACSIVLHYRKTDTTNRNTLAFGTGPANNVSDYLLAKIPDNTGAVLWYYGGAVAGTTLLSIGGLTVTDNVWVFTVGPRGMEIWQDGIRRASNAATPTRTNSSGQFWGLFGGLGVLASDAAESGCVLVYDRQLEVAEIAALSIDPWTPFRPARRAVALGNGAVAPSARVFIPSFIG